MRAADLVISALSPFWKGDDPDRLLRDPQLLGELIAMQLLYAKGYISEEHFSLGVDMALDFSRPQLDQCP